MEQDDVDCRGVQILGEWIIEPQRHQSVAVPTTRAQRPSTTDLNAARSQHKQLSPRAVEKDVSSTGEPRYVTAEGSAIVLQQWVARVVRFLKKTPRYCWPTPFKVRRVLFLGGISSAFLPSKKASWAHQFSYLRVGQQYRGVL